jgi:hypothetical protein
MPKIQQMLVAVFAMSASVGVHAQPAFDGLAASTAMNMMHEQVRNQMMGIEEEEEQGATSPSRKPGRQPSVTTAVSAQALTFTPSLARRKANFAQFVAKSRAVDPAGAAQLQQLFASTDVIAALDKAIQPFGLRANNVADAYTVWWVSSWLAANERTDTSTRAQFQGAKAQASKALLATPLFATATEASKQEMAEIFLIQAGMIDAYVEQSKTNPQQMKLMAKAVRQGALATGVDLDAMTLGATGFVPRTKTASIAPAMTRTTAQAAPPKISGQKQAVAAPPVVNNSAVWSQVHMVVFRMWGDLQYYLTVLFKDGSSYDVDDASLETMNLAASKKSEQNKWERWRQQGDKYLLIDRKGNVSDFVLGDGGLHRSFPAPAQGMTLNALYKSVTGSQMGEMSTMTTSTIRFLPNGRFQRDNTFVASGSGDVSGVSMGGGSEAKFAGKYRIAGHRIILEFDNGKKWDYFFGFGSEGKPPRPDTHMIFVGDGAFVKE